MIWGVLVTLLPLACMAAELDVSKNAYVVFATRPEEVLGLLVVGNSFEEVRSLFPRVAVVENGALDDEKQDILKKQGWKIYKAEDYEQYNPLRPRAFAFYMSDYERVIVLSPNLVLNNNIDILFDCGEFCAVVRDTYFDESVMVVTPNADVAQQIASHPAYKDPTFTEHEFLNMVFAYMDHMPMFIPGEPTPPFAYDGPSNFRLPSTFNGQVFLYYMRESTWFYEMGKPPKVMVFPGPTTCLAPWHWYGHFMLSLSHKWFLKLTEVLPTEPVVTSILRILAPAALGALLFRFLTFRLAVLYALAERALLAVFHPSEDAFRNHILGVFGMLWTAASIPLADYLTPDIIDRVHPFVSMVVFFEWMVVLVGIFFMMVYRLPSANRAPFTSEILSDVPTTRFELPGLLLTMLSIVLFFSFSTLVHASGLRLIVKFGISVLLLACLFVLTIYRLPIIMSTHHHEKYSSLRDSEGIEMSHTVTRSSAEPES